MSDEDHAALVKRVQLIDMQISNTWDKRLKKKLGIEKLTVQNRHKYLRDTGVRGHVSQRSVDERRQRRMEMVDAYPAAVRELVHHYGLPIVKSLWDLGIRNPRNIRHVVETVLDEFSPTRGSRSFQGPVRARGGDFIERPGDEEDAA